jgi:hypothetical protein
MEIVFKEWGTYIVGIMTIAISIWVSIYIFIKQKKSKKLGFITMLNYNMFNIKEIVKEKISITYAGEKAEYLRLIILKIVNNGDLPIIKTDFENEIQIIFNKNSKLIDAEIIQKSPENIDLNFKIKSDKILIEPCLINPKDFFIIRAILNSAEDNFFVNSRIAGIEMIKEIVVKDSKINRSNIYLYYIISIGSIIEGLLFCLVVFYKEINNREPYMILLILLLLLNCYFMFFFNRKDRNKIIPE